ncbi:signal peptidase I [Halovenus rubra]|uniref:Signal peptidase I n=2 Tax=Halovenus rubra TaxID=869890 RepID=A0ACC7DYQ8_9EURY|nr:signal peptidase I [Halovenus rubra]
MFRRRIRSVAKIIVVLLILATAGGAIIGQPAVLSFVTSDSMSPTIQTGDGFIAVPDVVTGDIEKGDVVVFEAEEIEGGKLTTHRVVDETEDGYITKGDGNPFTDQDGVEPPVTDDQIVATAWQPGGNVVTLPSLGTVVLGGRSLIFEVQETVTTVLGLEGADTAGQMGSVLLLAGLVLLGITVGDSIRGSDRTRSRKQGESEWLDPRYAVIVLVAVVALPANAAMVLPSSTHQVPVEGAAFQDEATPGEPVDVSLSATNEGLVTMLVAFESAPDTTLQDRQLGLPGGDTVSTTMYVPAPPPDEQRTVSIDENRYVMILPPSFLMALHDIHPMVALGAINVTIIVSITTLVVGLLGLRRRRVRQADRGVPLVLRIKRRL